MSPVRPLNWLKPRVEPLMVALLPLLCAPGTPPLAAAAESPFMTGDGARCLQPCLLQQQQLLKGIMVLLLRSAASAQPVQAQQPRQRRGADSSPVWRS
jgi:hypothetical protein